MKTKCSYANKYQAMRPPRCGCLTCRDKWERREVYGRGPAQQVLDNLRAINKDMQLAVRRKFWTEMG